MATSFLVVHEIAPALKPTAFAAVARALRAMPTRFAALAQWYELTWGNVVDTRSALHERCREAGLEVAEETAFSRFHIILATRP